MTNWRWELNRSTIGPRGIQHDLTNNLPYTIYSNPELKNDSRGLGNTIRQKE